MSFVYIFEEPITRFEVIDGDGMSRIYVGVSVEVSIQDDGRTMKVFVTEKGQDNQ
jgi:hypothetical protein